MPWLPMARSRGDMLLVRASFVPPARHGAARGARHIQARTRPSRASSSAPIVIAALINPTWV